MHYAADRIAKFYKKSVVGMYLGDFPLVLINGGENVKKMLNNRNFDGRPDILMGRMRHPEMDLHGGHYWIDAKLILNKC